MVRTKSNRIVTRIANEKTRKTELNQKDWMKLRSRRKDRIQNDKEGKLGKTDFLEKVMEKKMRRKKKGKKMNEKI